MIKDSWAESTHAFSSAGGLPTNLTFSAQKQAQGGLVLRAVNHGQAALSLKVGIEEGATWLPKLGTEAAVTTLSGEDLKGDNSPSNIDAIAPKTSRVALSASKILPLNLPGYSFVVATLAAASDGRPDM